jgi:hypothetical protein
MLWLITLALLTALGCVLVVYGACCLVSGMSDAMPEDLDSLPAKWQEELERDRDWHKRRNEFVALQYLTVKGLTRERAETIIWCASLDRPMTFEEVENEVNLAAGAAIDYWKRGE